MGPLQLTAPHTNKLYKHNLYGLHWAVMLIAAHRWK